jgi:hypothetical protein
MGAGAGVATAGLAEVELVAEVEAEAGGDPHAFALPEANPATTHGVVSELI